MKNLILTICLSAAVSFSFAQIDVVGPAGNVGMGVTNPTEKLHVKGKLKIENTGTSAASIFNRTDGSSFAIGAGYSNAGFMFDSNYDFQLRSGPSGSILAGAVGGGGSTVQLHIGTDGRVGIGTYAPAAKLHVNGWVTYAGAFVTSDKRVKSDIEPFKLGLEEVLALNPINFSYTGTGGTTAGSEHVGLIAQELQEVAPMMVKEFTYSDIEYTEEGEKIVNGKENYLSIKDNEIKYMLLNAIKDQQKIIENLENKVDELVEKVGSGTNFGTVLLDGASGSKALLSQNTPNPLKNETNIEYYIPEKTANASLNVYDLSGKLIKSVVLNDRGLGTINFKVKNLVSGLYTYTLKIDGISIDTKKMIIQ